MDVRLDTRSEYLIEQQLQTGHFRTAEEVIACALETLAEQEPVQIVDTDRHQAVREMLEFADKHRFSLRDSLRLRELIHEGHKY